MHNNSSVKGCMGEIPQKVIKMYLIIKTVILHFNLCPNVSVWELNQKWVKKDMSKLEANITSGSSVTAAN